MMAAIHISSVAASSSQSWWLDSIGRIPLLSPAEEIELGTAIQRCSSVGLHAQLDPGSGFGSSGEAVEGGGLLMGLEPDGERGNGCQGA